MDNKTIYSGMTVNERLHVSGLMHRYDEAVEKKDKDEAILILKSVDLGEENIRDILKFDGLIDNHI